MTRAAAGQEVGELWLSVLQRAMARASHDVKDALNGVSVNLEVIRSRSARPDTPAAAVANFGEAAGQQLDRLTTLIEAVLALGRKERDPADVAITLRRIVTVCGASSSMADAAVLLVDSTDGAASTTRVAGMAVRLALLGTLLDVVAGVSRAERASAVTCELRGTPDAVQVRISADGRRAAVPEWASAVLSDAGVRWTDAGNELSLEFPRA